MDAPVTENKLQFSPHILEALRKAKLTDEKVLLTLSCSDLTQLTGLSRSDVQKIQDEIAEHFKTHRICTALELHQAETKEPLLPWKLSTNCPILDEALQGGLLPGVLTEISGESACGKTQLCLQLCISVQVCQNGGAMYICTEDVFPSRRLQQLIKFHSSQSSCRNLGDRIFIEHVADFETLDLCVNKKIPALLDKGLARLVVIDSVAALFRCHYDVSQVVERAKHLTKFAILLQTLASRYSIPVVCVNQVSANMATGTGVTPALGLTWANQVACRLVLSRPVTVSEATMQLVNERRKLDAQSIEVNVTFRELNVVFAPHLAQTLVSVYIDHCGVHGIPS